MTKVTIHGILLNAMIMKKTMYICIILESVFAPIVVGIMGARLWLRKHRHRSFLLSDYVVIYCIVCYLAAYACKVAAFCLLDQYSTGPPSPERRAKLSLATKIYFCGPFLYVNFVWGLKAVVLLFIQNIWGDLPWPRIWIRLAWVYQALTYTATMVMLGFLCTGVGYSPVLTGKPAIHCITANDFLRIYGCLHASSEIVLILLPIPWLIKVKQPWKKRILLLCLFSLGILAVFVSLARGFFGHMSYGVTTIMNVSEGTLAALAANLPTMYSLRHRRLQHHFPPSSSATDPECTIATATISRRQSPAHVVTDSQILADSWEDSDTDGRSERPSNTRVSSQGSTEPLFPRQIHR
ncbi:uncharacterized protein BP01DRAFT_369540 [Aspergillus saccharolyticus JOP 1030-1]|uniref:Rhodopsin domain-containing protein n=1 Tax=Aspergillus saccharolyticus JOP 1030-1 TaxID=1450539 RepID=A0A318ZKT5_9EURO|nr:hypothetical protein BP01DRAFT_369540 [Aspergillus saccharolyticus JOP 1030-1]PYH40848.1 hypothetical protein BP01DRAFT_369540 [Aspergillus saccharolyticus JOP 1030-1]